MFGYQSMGSGNQVYFDPATQQYYTMSGFGMNREKNYLNGMG